MSYVRPETVRVKCNGVYELSDGSKFQIQRVTPTRNGNGVYITVPSRKFVYGIVDAQTRTPISVQAEIDLSGNPTGLYSFHEDVSSEYEIMISTFEQLKVRPSIQPLTLHDGTPVYVTRRDEGDNTWITISVLIRDCMVIVEDESGNAIPVTRNSDKKGEVRFRGDLRSSYTVLVVRTQREAIKVA